MAKQCNPNDAMPKTCADAFAAIQEGIGRLDERMIGCVTAIEGATRSIRELYGRTNGLQADAAVRKSWGGKAWHIFTVILAAIAGALAGRWMKSP